MPQESRQTFTMTKTPANAGAILGRFCEATDGNQTAKAGKHMTRQKDLVTVSPFPSLGKRAEPGRKGAAPARNCYRTKKPGDTLISKIWQKCDLVTVILHFLRLCGKTQIQDSGQERRRKKHVT